MPLFRHVCFAFALLFSAVAATFSAEKTAAELLPASTVFYAEILAPATIIDVLKEHPLRERIESLPGTREALDTKQYRDLKAAVAVIEAQFGMEWPEILKATTGGGISVAIDGRTEGAVVLLRATDEQMPSKLIATLTGLARADAAGKGEPDPIKSGEYRGITAYQVANSRVAAFGPWLLATNKSDLGKTVLDNYLDAGQTTIASNEEFKAARATAPAEAVAWSYVDLNAVRASGKAKPLESGRTDNPVAELLAGGIVDSLQHASFATSAWFFDAKHMRFELAIPHDPSQITEAREFYFGPEGQGTAPPLLQVENELLSVGTYRDVSTMWLRAGDLFNEKAVDDLAKADSNLSTLFGGKDFGEDILGAVRPEIQIVVARQEFNGAGARPAIKLPAFALVFRLKDVEAMQPEMRRTFQNLIGFLNIVGAMNGQPQLELDMEKSDGLQIVSGNYLVAKSTNPLDLKIHYNFSPSVAFIEDRFIVASTKQFAREVAEAATKVDSQPAPQANTVIRANFASARDALADNRGQLVAQNMLAEGHTMEEAERDIENLLKIIAGFRDATIRLDQTAGQLRLSWEVNFAESN